LKDIYIATISAAGVLLTLILGLIGQLFEMKHPPSETTTWVRIGVVGFLVASCFGVLGLIEISGLLIGAKTDSRLSRLCLVGTLMSFLVGLLALAFAIGGLTSF
jgi:hypothetical protein